MTTKLTKDSVPEHTAPLPNRLSKRSKEEQEWRWRPNSPPKHLKNKRGKIRATRMNETAKRMLGLMSVMMGGRAAGATTAIFNKQNPEIQTGLDGNICMYFFIHTYF